MKEKDNFWEIEERKDEAGLGNPKRTVCVIGHKNPDTDSICSAIAYAYLKNLDSGDFRYVPVRAGQISAETQYVLNHFQVDAPPFLDNIGTRVRDMAIRQVPGVRSNISLKNAWNLMITQNVYTLPITNEENQLKGLITVNDIAKSYMDVYDNTILSTARTQYKNIVETLDGQLLTGNEHAYFVHGKVVIGIGTPEGVTSAIDKDDLVMIGDGEESQMLSIASNCSCMIVTNGYEISQEVIEAAKEREVVLISTPYDTFTAARLINQSMPIKHFMTKKGIIHFDLDDYVDEVRETVANIRHRDFPVLDENQNYVGMFSRRNLMKAEKKKLILVDHNEKSQAVSNIDEAEILEIIDHHRLGSLETMSPVYFRNQPLGCTSTIIYQMYLEKGITITSQMAGLMCAAILSDTLMFRSPTCTQIDREAALRLAEIAEVKVEELASAMFQAGSNFDNKTEEEILNQDFKIFHAEDVSFGVAQISAMGRTELDKVQERIEPKLEQMMGEKQIQMIFVMLTDILNESTYLIYRGADASQLVAAAYNCEPSNQGIMLENVVSRKKQLIPALINTLAERKM